MPIFCLIFIKLIFSIIQFHLLNMYEFDLNQKENWTLGELQAYKDQKAKEAKQKRPTPKSKAPARKLRRAGDILVWTNGSKRRRNEGPQGANKRQRQAELPVIQPVDDLCTYPWKFVSAHVFV